MKTKRDMAMRFHCPACGAKPQHLCKGDRGHRLSVHASRMAKAKVRGLTKQSARV
jgi:hypothetical protein